MSLNKVMLIGNVGKDPEVRYLDGNSGNPENRVKVATFTLATSDRYRDRNGELHENTEWHSIVAWRGSAEYAEKYVRKGTSLFVEGKIRTRSWTDPAGAKRYTTEIAVDGMQTLGRRPDSYDQQGGGYQRGGSYGQAAQGGYQQSGQAFGGASGQSSQGGSYGQAPQGGQGQANQMGGVQRMGYGSGVSAPQGGAFASAAQPRPGYDSAASSQPFGGRPATQEDAPKAPASEDSRPAAGVDDLPF